ncbi:MAG: GerMN domain-containing protein, partial [Acidimicrobiales bacterium]|nr:GerMN domain-containing protein [Acidimicrobiales bacterium]
ESVRVFQVSNQLAPDMIVGPLTWGRLIPYYEPTCVRPGVAAPGPGQMAVLVFFTCARDGDESPPVALSRAVPQSPAVLRTALDQLLAGPDQAERAAGFSSWFSDATAGMVNSVALEPSGRAIVDLGDLRPIIPGASSSAGSRLLLSQLDATVFQFPSVRSVRYQLNGSCDAFFEWLQAQCHDRPRSGGLT